jgi:hypothetical protein
MKLRLIKLYPGSKELGYTTEDDRCLPDNWVNVYKCWKPIKCFRVKHKRRSRARFLWGLDALGGNKIIDYITRISDGEIFKVGDSVLYKYCRLNKIYTINKFILISDYTICIYLGNLPTEYIFDIEHLTKIK